MSKNSIASSPSTHCRHAAANNPAQQLETISNDIPRRHRLIELLISRHEEMIEHRTLSFAKGCPGLEADALLSRFYFKLTKSCINQDALINLQDANLNPLNPLEERNLLSCILKRACIDEWRRWKHHAYRSKSFSQMEDFKPGGIPSDSQAPTTPAKQEYPAVRLADRLAQLQVELTDREFNVLLCKLMRAANNKPLTHADIALKLNISPKTVQRELGRITEKVYLAKYGSPVEGTPATASRREDFRRLLKENRAIHPEVKRYLEAYVELTSDGKRPAEDALCKKLAINNNQLKNRQRRAAKLREGLLGVTARTHAPLPARHNQDTATH